MSYINDILSAFETAIAASATFGAAKIYQREELTADFGFPADPSDAAPVNQINVYLQPMEPRQHDTGFAIDMRVYPIRVVIAFREETRARTDVGTDPLVQRKSDYSDAMKTAMKTVSVSKVYDIEWVGPEDLNFAPPEEKLDETSVEIGAIHRIAQTYECYAHP